MVKLKLHLSREHVEEFSKQVYDKLLKDRESDYFSVTLCLGDVHDCKEIVLFAL